MEYLQPISEWRVLAASVCGTSHEKNNQLCQDAHQWQVLPDNILVAACADGAGSAILGKVGAIVAVETAVEYLASKEITQSTLNDDRLVRSLLSEAMAVARQAVEEESVVCHQQPRDLASTLIILLATQSLVAVAQIGDGAAVARDIDDNLIALTKPQSGEYINETTFLISPGALDNVEIVVWRQPIKNVGVITDGLQMLAMNIGLGIAHQRFFTPLFDFVNTQQNKQLAIEELVKFLRSERIKQRTDDDLTLLLEAITS
ncbi:MAG: PP2C family serine/threonine-protein phosphatase [Sphaerospermopsis sp.]|nr:PP2C family serine/threonine-protein phosphatase [Sphaerospermopsis sp.]